MSLPNFITESDLYKNGEGWLKIYADKLGIKLDQSKFALGEGYWIYIPHFGAVDPIIGSIEGPYWYNDKDMFLGVIDYFHKTEKWTKYLKDALKSTDICEILGIEDKIDAMTLEEIYIAVMGNFPYLLLSANLQLKPSTSLLCPYLDNMPQGIEPFHPNHDQNNPKP